MDNGYVLLHRKICSNDFWLSEKFTKAQAWIDLFLNANHKDGSFWVRGNEIKVLRGQIGWSEQNMAKRWRWSRNKVRMFLFSLEKRHQIVQQKSPLTTVITILNYDSYQEWDNRKYSKQYNRQYNRKTSEGTQTKNDKEELKNEKEPSGVPPQDIQDLIYSFKDVNPSYERLFGNKTERLASERLLRKYGREKMLATTLRLKDIIIQPYAPRITTPYDLEKNLGKLIAFMGQEKIKTSSKVAFT